MLPLFLRDAQAALGFLVQQLSVIEPEVIRIQYPDIQYPSLIPVDTSANEWAKSITFFSMEKVGQAQWFSHLSTDMPLADVERSKFEQGIEMAGIGYRVTMEEIGQAQMLNMNIRAEKAEAARRAYEEFIDDVALRGDTKKNWTGLINNASVTQVFVQNDGVGDSPDWGDKSGDQIIRDVNDALTGVYTASRTVEMADTILLPVSNYTRLSTTPRSSNTDQSILDWLSKYNVFTATTGQPLMIRAVRGLETAGEGGVGRMVVYRRDPRVLKMHLPMPHRFLAPWPTGPLFWDIPGIFRFGGVEVRRPGAMRYVDGIYDAEYQ